MSDERKQIGSLFGFPVYENPELETPELRLAPPVKGQPVKIVRSEGGVFVVSLEKV